MNYVRIIQSIFSMAFLLVIHTSSVVVAAENSGDNRPGQGYLDRYAPEYLRADKWWNERQARIEKEQAALYVGEKPQTVQAGYYKDGRYVQLTYDQQGFVGGLMAGGFFRFLYSAATCGTEYKKFKSAAIVPGIAKSFLFWVPAFVAYRFVVNGKDHDAFVQKMKDKAQKYSPNHQFGQDKVD